MPRTISVIEMTARTSDRQHPSRTLTPKATDGNLRCEAVGRTVIVNNLNLSSDRERCQARCENGTEVSDCNRCQLAASDRELDPGG